MESTFKNSGWYKRQGANRHLVLLSLILFLLALALAVSLAVILHKQNEQTDQEVCLTPGCLHSASTVLKYIDESVDPCDDFYEFACGGFLKNDNIPEDKSSITSFGTISDTVTDQLKAIVDEPLQPGASKPYHLIKKFYNMCMNTSAFEVNGMPTVEAILKDLGGWPLLDGENWNEGKFEWKNIIYKFRKLGFGTGYFIGFGVGTDEKNSSRRIINLGEPSLGLSREYLLKGLEEKLVKYYYDYMVDMGVLFGANRTSVLREFNDTLEFQIALAKICLPREEARNVTALYNPMTVEELHNRYPSIPWLEYINKVLDIPDIEITEDEVVNVEVPQFFYDLEVLLRRTPKRVQANYIIGRTAVSLAYTLPQRFRNRHDDYSKIVSGRTESPPRWKSCTRMATGSVYLARGAWYVRKHFNEDAKKHVKKMVTYIRNEFVKILNTSDWMDEDTREKALEKAASMVAYIGYPDELLDEKNIEKFYLNLEITSDNYFEAVRSLSLFRTDYYYKQLREPVNKSDWIRQTYPTTVNAFYSFTENSIKLPAGILQGVFFSDDRPSYMNYGGIGYTIGHEITHGFDDRGRQFDKDGNLVNWWAEDTKTAFTKKAQCIIDQYGNYSVPEVDLNLNGINTQGENIADNGGIKEAYLAYQSWVKHNGPEPQLPGLDYTPNQMFWISAGNIWCSKYRKEILKMQVTTGSHSPAQFRILGSFSNTDYFAKDFDCPLGCNMNPIKKCQVW